MCDPRLYSLGPYVIASELPLPGLLERRAPAAVPDLTIRATPRPPVDDPWTLIARAHGRDTPWGRIALWQHGAAGEYCLRFDYHDDFAHFFIGHDGATVGVSTSANVTPEHLATLIEGPVIGRALRLRGRPCLHATFLEWRGRAVGFMGPSGAGKSTLASALAAAGCALLTDDLAAIERMDDGYAVHPGRARVRLWPEGAAALAVDTGAADPILAGVYDADKLAVPLGDDRRGEPPVPLAALVQIAPRLPDALTHALGALPPGAALAAVAANFYGAIRPAAAARRAELAHAADIAARVPLLRVQLPHSIDYLRSHAAAIRDRLFA